MKRTKRTEVMIGVAVMLALMLAGKLAVEVKTEAAAVTTMGNILTVTSPLDDGSQGTLRQAIADAMAGDTIDFALNYPATITLTSGELGIGKNLTIKGPGVQSLKVSGNHVFQVFQVGPGTTVNLSGLTIADGHAGGGIDNRGGTLTVTDCTISGNSAEVDGGGIGNSGTLTIINSTVSGNSVTAQLSNSNGGGIGNSGTVTIKNSIVANNNKIVNSNQYSDNCNNFSQINALGTNFSTDGTCGMGFTQVTSAELNLLPLTLNAPGLTATHALGPESKAIDAVDNCTDLNGNPVTADQRGVARPQGPKCDAGAFEAEFHYNFEGFLQPVNNPPTVNVAKAGASVAVNFSLGGNQGLDIFAAGSPASQEIVCVGGAPIADIIETVTPGNSSLSYDATLDQYTYVWKTDKAWKGTCRQFVLTLKDGSTHVANFQFK